MACRDLETVLAELSRIRADYEDAVDPSEKTRLRSRLAELRSEANQLDSAGLSGLSNERLRDRIHHVERRLEDLAARRVDPSMAAISNEAGGGGIDPTAVLAQHRAVDEAGGRAELTAELVALRAEVDRRSAADT